MTGPRGRAAWHSNAKRGTGPRPTLLRPCACTRRSSYWTTPACCGSGSGGKQARLRRATSTSGSLPRASVRSRTRCSRNRDGATATPRSSRSAGWKPSISSAASSLQASDLDDATLEALRITADRLCSEYPFLPSDQLLTEGKNWLRRLTQPPRSGPDPRPAS